MATDSWEASATKSRGPAGRLGQLGFQAENKTLWSWRWPRLLLQPPKGSPLLQRSSVYTLTACQALCRKARQVPVPATMCSDRHRPEETHLLGRAHTALGAGDREWAWDSLGRVKPGPQQGKGVPTATGRR